jgi:hypothetical protein
MGLSPNITEGPHGQTMKRGYQKRHKAVRGEGRQGQVRAAWKRGPTSPWLRGGSRAWRGEDASRGEGVLGYRAREESRKSVHAGEQEWTREGWLGLDTRLCPRRSNRATADRGDLVGQGRAATLGLLGGRSDA